MLKAAHHGSKYSTASSFLERTKPKAAVISCGKENSYGHPHKELLKRLEEYSVKIYNTMDVGAVLIMTNGVGVRMKGFMAR